MVISKLASTSVWDMIYSNKGSRETPLFLHQIATLQQMLWRFAQNVLSLHPREKANDSLGEKLTILNVQNFLKNV